MRTFSLFLLASILCWGCSSSELEDPTPAAPENPVPEEPAPVLEIRFEKTECQPNETITGQIFISHDDMPESFSVATTLLNGTARIAIDGVFVPTAGEWITMEADTLHVSIVPDREGEVRIGFRARTLTNGICSNSCEIALTAEYPPKLTAIVDCESRIVNPEPDTTQPIHLTIDYPKFEGEYVVVPSVSRNAGIFIYDGKEIGTGGIITTTRNPTIIYRPTVLGDQSLAFEIRAGEATTTAVAYIEVVKNFTVTCPITEGIAIAGTGEYAVEGGTARFEMVNRQGYNFEAAGWYDGAGDLLSEGNICSVVVNYTTPTELRLELKKRVVELTLTAPYHKAYKYPIANGNGQIAGWKTVYDYRRNFQTDYNISDNIYFYYEKYRWQTSIPPVEQKEWTIEKANGYFWRIDNRFELSIRRSDNPDLVFDRTQHAVESASTRYIIPKEIIMQ